MLPLPSRSHPQKRNRAVYTKELTHLMDMLAYRTNKTIAHRIVQMLC